MIYTATLKMIHTTKKFEFNPNISTSARLIELW